MPHKSLLGFVAAALLTFAALPSAFAQESSSRPDAIQPAPDPPSAALRDLISAACAHNESAFAKFLTARNAEAFSRLSPTARVEFMKRIVLLDGVGEPESSTNSSGRPTIRCATADGAAELQLGGTELRDSLAILPIDIRDVSDLRAGDPHHIQMGMIRENSSWKILSIGMLFLDLPSLEIEWDQAAIGPNEQDALAALKSIAAAIEAYRRTYSRLPESISKLGKSPKPSPDAAGLLDADLAAGQTNGYAFRMVVVGANEIGAPAKYELSATPLSYGRTGKLSFFRDSSGVLHSADHQGAIGKSTDPVIQ